MRFKIDIECTPEEARTFFGMPDIAPFNNMIVDEMKTRAKDQMDTLADPERFVRQWVEMSGKSMDAFQGMMGAAASAATGGAMRPKK